MEETALGGKWRLALCGGDSSRGQVEVGTVWRRETALGGKWRLALCGGDSSRGQVEVGSVWRRQL